MKKKSTAKLRTAQLAGAVEYTDCISAEWVRPLPHNKWPKYDIKQSCGHNGEVPALLEPNIVLRVRNAPALGNTEYPFIAITPRSTLTQSGCTL